LELFQNPCLHKRRHGDSREPEGRGIKIEEGQLLLPDRKRIAELWWGDI